MKIHFTDHSPVRAILPFCLLMLLLAVASPASQVHRYREQTGDTSFTFLWRAEQGQAGVTIVQDQGDETYSSLCTPEGKTLSWRYRRPPDTDVRAERIGDRIDLTGRFDGREINRSQPLDGRPWFQPLSFSLQRMVADGHQTATFWTIRPDMVSNRPRMLTAIFTRCFIQAEIDQCLPLGRRCLRFSRLLRISRIS